MRWNIHESPRTRFETYFEFLNVESLPRSSTSNLVPENNICYCELAPRLSK